MENGVKNMIQEYKIPATATTVADLHTTITNSHYRNWVFTPMDKNTKSIAVM
jgi:hypothetical protein